MKNIVFDFDAFHVLPADIENAVDLRVKERGRIVVGNSFDFSFVETESGFQQGFSIPGGTAVGDGRVFGQKFLQFQDRPLRRQDGGALVVVVIGEQEASVFGDERQFGRGTAGIDAEVAASVVLPDVFAMYLCRFMTGDECIVFGGGVEQGLHPFDFRVHQDTVKVK